MADCGNDGRPACTGMWGVCRSSRAARAPPMYLRHSGPPLRPTQPFLALSAVQSSRYSLPSEHKGVGEGRDKVIRIHSTHRPTNSSYNRRPEDSTSATQVPSRDSPGTAIIQPRSASCSGTGYHAQANYIHGTPARAHIQLHSKARGGRH
jgi:hypothetical protein